MVQNSPMYFHHNYFSKEDCINIFRELWEMSAKKWVSAETIAGPTDYRTCETCDIFAWPNQFFDEWIKNIFITANTKFGADLSGGRMEGILVRYHGGNGGHYNWHHDTYDEIMDRKLSMSVQLSPKEDYDGCILEIEDGMNKPHTDQGWTEQGTAVVFESYRRHRVTPCTRGTRVALVCWHHGPKWR